MLFKKGDQFNTLPIMVTFLLTRTVLPLIFRSFNVQQHSQAKSYIKKNI